MVKCTIMFGSRAGVLFFTDREHFLDVVSDAVDGPREDKRRNETSVDEPTS